MKRYVSIVVAFTVCLYLNASEMSQTSSTPVLRMGVIGDSVSVPYATQPWKGTGPAPKNWLELLVDARNISVGEWKPSQADREGAGYSWVWAQSGFSTSMALSKQWDVAAAKALANGEIDAVVVFLGHDDFKPFLLAKLANRTLERAEAEAVVSNLEVNLGRILDRLAEAKRGKVYVLTLAPWQHVPFVNYQRPTPAEIALLTETMTQANNRISVLAEQRGMPIVDISKRFCELVDRRRPLAIEGVNVSIHCGGEGGEWFFRSDGMHVGSVASALLVNDLITAFNLNSLSNRRLKIPLFTNPEIANLAGLKQPSAFPKKEGTP